MWPKTQMRSALERYSLRRENFAARQRGKFGLRVRECVDNRLVLLPQDAAGGVNQTTARFHQTRGGGEDSALLFRKLADRIRSVPPLQVRISPQSAETAARRVDQHAIELSGQALGASVVVARQRNRVQ